VSTTSCPTESLSFRCSLQVWNWTFRKEDLFCGGFVVIDLHEFFLIAKLIAKVHANSQIPCTIYLFDTVQQKSVYHNYVISLSQEYCNQRKLFQNLTEHNFIVQETYTLLRNYVVVPRSLNRLLYCR
jgi:hypothetical protein